MSDAEALEGASEASGADAPLRYFRRVTSGVNVAPILADLAANPDLWDEFTERTAAPHGAMAGTSDIWVRYFPRETLRTAADYLGEGRCEFYRAWHALPSIQSVAFGLMQMCRGVELGVGLITRIPPGGEVKPHADGAAWSARYYNRKFYLVLAGNDACENVTLDERIVILPGDTVEFDNLVPHSVHNRGTTERITLIFTLRSADA